MKQAGRAPTGTAPSTSHHALRPRRVCCTGAGKNLSSANARFAERLGWTLAGEEGLLIVTGGYKHDVDSPQSPGTDWQVAKGALDRIQTDGVTSEARLVTYLPDPEQDRAANVRFEVGRVERLRTRSAQARRFCMVSACDVVTTLQGRKGTGEIIDMALAIERPVLPLPFTGGVSRDRWLANREIIQDWFEIDDATADALEPELAEDDDARVSELATTVTRLLLRRLRRRCFVIMPFADQHLPIYEEGIKAAVVQQGLTPVRSDRLNLVGNAVEVLKNAINACDCSIAVITGSNPNVMYELGLAHAQGKPVILLCQYMPGARQLPDLPFDLRSEYVVGYGFDMTELRQTIAAVLGQLYGTQT